MNSVEYIIYNAQISKFVRCLWEKNEFFIGFEIFVLYITCFTANLDVSRRTFFSRNSTILIIAFTYVSLILITFSNERLNIKFIFVFIEITRFFYTARGLFVVDYDELDWWFKLLQMIPTDFRVVRVRCHVFVFYLVPSEAMKLLVLQ